MLCRVEGRKSTSARETHPSNAESPSVRSDLPLTLTDDRLVQFWKARFPTSVTEDEIETLFTLGASPESEV